MKIRHSILTLLMVSMGFAAPAPVWLAGRGGLYFTELDQDKGQLSEVHQVLAYGSGSWLEYHPTRPIIYGTLQEKDRSGVIALTYTAAGSVTPLDEIEIPLSSVSHFAINSTATLLVGAHWGGQSTSVVSLHPDGSFHRLEHIFAHYGSGPRGIQNQPRPHWAGFSPDESIVHVTDLGTDAIWNFRIMENDGAFQLKLRNRYAVPAGMGPRHLSFHPGGRFAYATEELAHHVTAFEYDPQSARFAAIEHLDTTPADVDEWFNNVSELRVHPSGKFLYVGNRGHDTIAVFALDESTGRMTLVEREPVRGAIPRNFSLTADGKWLVVAGQDSDTLALFAINASTGELTYARSNVTRAPAAPGTPAGLIALGSTRICRQSELIRTRLARRTASKRAVVSA